MNISIESQLLNHSQRSGLMTYTEGLVTGLYHNDQKNDYDLLYYSLTRKAKNMPGPNGSEKFTKSVLKIPDRPFIGRQSFIDQIFIPNYLKRRKIDVFHRPSGYTMPKVKGVRTILTVHDLRTLTMKDEILKQNIDQYRKSLEGIDICTVVSECTKRDLLKHFNLNEKKIRVTYLGADSRFAPSEAQRIKEVNVKFQLDEPYFLSVGSVPRKNLDGTLKAFAQSKCREKMLLAICCNWEYEKYKSLVDTLGINNRVRFLDKPSDDDIVALYSGSRAFLFPSFYEGFGLPILEAMQCKTAVVTSNMSACPEVAGNAAVLVNPHEIGEITQAMDALAENNTLRQQLIDKGVEQAKLFSWKKFANEMREIYEMS